MDLDREMIGVYAICVIAFVVGFVVIGKVLDFFHRKSRQNDIDRMLEGMEEYEQRIRSELEKGEDKTRHGNE